MDIYGIYFSPTGGTRSIDPQMLQATSQKLAAACTQKKPIELFL